MVDVKMLHELITNRMPRTQDATEELKLGNHMK